jgi:hypothetical protein
MQRRFYKHPFFILLPLLAVAGCTKKAPSVAYLRPLTSYIDTNTTKHGITVRAKQLSPHDCLSLLGSKAPRLFKKQRQRQPIYPIQLSITNHTNKLIALDPCHIELPLVNYHSVARRLHQNSVLHAAGGIFAGLLISSLLTAGSIFALSASGILLVIIGSMKALAPIAILGGSALLIAPFFLVIGTPIASTVKGVKTAKNNQLLTKEIKAHTLRNSLIIEPNTTIDTLIFVSKRDFKNQFTIALCNPENAKELIPFTIMLQNHSF